MTLDQIRAYCLARPGGTEDMPFGDGVLAFRVRGRIFLLANLDAIPPTVNVKCDPARAIEWRERCAGVRPGYHMNKRHWNTIVLDGSVPSADIRRMIGDSFDLVSHARPGTGGGNGFDSGRRRLRPKSSVSGGPSGHHRRK